MNLYFFEALKVTVALDPVGEDCLLGVVTLGEFGFYKIDECQGTDLRRAAMTGTYRRREYFGGKVVLGLDVLVVNRLVGLGVRVSHAEIAGLGSDVEVLDRAHEPPQGLTSGNDDGRLQVDQALGLRQLRECFRSLKGEHRSWRWRLGVIEATARRRRDSFGVVGETVNSSIEIGLNRFDFGDAEEQRARNAEDVDGTYTWRRRCGRRVIRFLERP